MKHNSFYVIISALCAFSFMACKTTSNPVALESSSGERLFYTVEASIDTNQTGIHSVGIDGADDKLLYPGGIVTSAPRGGKLVFVSYPDRNDIGRNATIFLGDEAGDPAQALVTLPRSVNYAILLPDGSSVMYEYDNELHVRDIASGAETVLSASVGTLLSQRPTVSNDATKFYCTFETPQFGLFEVNQNLTSAHAIETKDVVAFLGSEIHQIYDLSADGATLVYLSRPVVGVAVDSGGKQDTLWTSPGDAITTYDLATGTITVDTSTASEADIDNLTCSPEGNLLAYCEENRLSSTGNEARVVIYSTMTHERTSIDIPDAAGQYGWIRSIEWSKDGSALFVAIWTDEYVGELLKLDVATHAITHFASPRLSDEWSIPMAFRSRDIGEH